MLKIGLLGYGKMGKTIEQLAASNGVEIVWRINRENRHLFNTAFIQSAQVVIEFSRPEAAFVNVMACLEAGVPVVSGTTGWANELPQANAYCQEKGGAFLWASNFSIGVNLFFALNRYLAHLMGTREEYHPSLVETHHIHKLDAPSGTAITLANDLIGQVSRLSAFQLLESDPPDGLPPDTLAVTARREAEVPGTHEIIWHSAIDDISIEHRAHSRQGFALGAITAAKWIANKHGVFTMNDVLNIQ